MTNEKDPQTPMSLGFHIATEDGLISVQIPGRIDLVDLYELAKNVVSETDYDPALPLLLDLRGMRLEIDRAAAEPFSRFMIQSFRGRPGSMAVVIDAEMSRKLSAATYWLACAVGGTEVFDDYDHALKWLIRREFADANGSHLTSAG
jgi:hypothetical protein